jgi:opacity protein-like surface antigen
MRRFLLAVVMCGAAAGAQAADMPDLPALRGSFTDGLSRSSVNWQGFYIGGQGGYGASDASFGNNQAMTAAMLANTAIESQAGVSQWELNLGKSTKQSSVYGAFTGYNWQWDDVVIGVEASYMHGSFGGDASASVRRFYGSRFADTFYHDITSSASSSIAISDMATLRARAGYAYGIFLPYAFGGVALGNADITRSVSVLDRYANYLPPFNTPCSNAGTPYCFSPSLTNPQHNRLIYGYSFGVGTEVSLFGGLFMRAEWEYIRFTSTVDTNINTVRAGVGYKF